MEAFRALGSLLTFGESSQSSNTAALVAWSTVLIIIVVVGLHTGLFIAMKSMLFPSGFRGYETGAGIDPVNIATRGQGTAGFRGLSPAFRYGKRRNFNAVTQDQVLKLAQAQAPK